MNEFTEPLLQFFGYQHLPPDLATVSRHFHDLALNLVAVLPRNPERTVALRKLLEAKDCAVRAVIFVDPNPEYRAPRPPNQGPALPAGLQA